VKVPNQTQTEERKPDSKIGELQIDELGISPAQVLANWEYYPDLKDPEIEIIPEVDIYPLPI
jgi:hypothetical protein